MPFLLITFSHPRHPSCPSISATDTSTVSTQPTGMQLLPLGTTQVRMKLPLHDLSPPPLRIPLLPLMWSFLSIPPNQLTALLAHLHDAVLTYTNGHAHESFALPNASTIATTNVRMQRTGVVSFYSLAPIFSHRSTSLYKVVCTCMLQLVDTGIALHLPGCVRSPDISGVAF